MNIMQSGKIPRKERDNEGNKEGQERQELAIKNYMYRGVGRKDD